MIVFHEESKTFHLYNNEISYVFKILENNQLGQLYYGKRIHDRRDFDHLLELFPRPMSPCSYKGDLSFSLEHIKQEYPVYGSGDLRHPAIDILQENGSHILNFEYVSHEIIQGKPKLKDLPATYVENENEAQTLIITLYDGVIETKLQLSYTIYQDFPVITRNTFIVNEGKQKLRLNQMMSMSLDLPDQDYEMIELTGSWARERSIKTRKLTEGIQSIYSLSISELDFYVLKKVWQFINDRCENNKFVVPISVNLSWMDFYDEIMMQKILKEMDRFKENGREHMARFEITETSYAAIRENRSGILESLRIKNAKILLDDFGSGFSSFGMLQDYDFDILKIDMSFIRKIGENPKTKSIVHSIIGMAHEIGIKTVAEGVETEEQVSFLRQSGCDYIQGYYYSKPLPEEEFVEFLEKADAE